MWYGYCLTFILLFVRLLFLLDILHLVGSVVGERVACQAPKHIYQTIFLVRNTLSKGFFSKGVYLEKENPKKILIFHKSIF